MGKELCLPVFYLMSNISDEKHIHYSQNSKKRNNKVCYFCLPLKEIVLSNNVSTISANRENDNLKIHISFRISRWRCMFFTLVVLVYIYIISLHRPTDSLIWLNPPLPDPLDLSHDRACAPPSSIHAKPKRIYYIHIYIYIHVGGQTVVCT